MGNKSVFVSRMALIASAAALVSACGGDVSGSSLDLGGVAAVGTPIENGDVTVTCKAGSGTAKTAVNTGSYAVNVAEGEGPCLIKVEGTVDGVAVAVTSLAPAAVAGQSLVVHVNPVTDLVTKAIIIDAGATLASFFANPATVLQSVSIQATTIVSAGNAALQSMGVTNVDFADFFSSATFVASKTGQGSPADVALDNLKNTGALVAADTTTSLPSGNAVNDAVNAAKEAVVVPQAPTGSTGSTGSTGATGAQ